MTPAQRTTLSFLDLALIMTGVMAMIASVGDRHPVVADAFSESFGQDKAARAQQVRLKLTALFEPQEVDVEDLAHSFTVAISKGRPRLGRDSARKLASWPNLMHGADVSPTWNTWLLS